MRLAIAGLGISATLMMVWNLTARMPADPAVVQAAIRDVPLFDGLGKHTRR